MVTEHAADGKRHTGGLEADDGEAALGRARLGGQHALHLLPHGQHQAADKVQHAHAHPRARSLLRSCLIRLRPHTPRARAVQPLVPARMCAHMSAHDNIHLTIKALTRTTPPPHSSAAHTCAHVNANVCTCIISTRP